MTKQQEIIQFLRSVETATVQEIFLIISWRHYYYKKRHLGEILTRMVQNGSIQRVKKGIYKAAGERKVRGTAIPDPNQQSLFN